MNDELVVLTSYRFAPKAELAKSCLEAAGIQAFLDNLAIITTDWFLGNAAGYIKLCVPRTQAAAAAAILQDHPELLDAKRPESPAESEEEADVCLACGEPMSDDADVCAKCGWSYDELSEDEA